MLVNSAGYVISDFIYNMGCPDESITSMLYPWSHLARCINSHSQSPRLNVNSIKAHNYRGDLRYAIETFIFETTDMRRDAR